MIIGAQLYSVRDKCSTDEDIRATFAEMKRIGYTTVQVSGFNYDAEVVHQAAVENGLHIGLTHTPIPEIIENTDEVIRKHKIIGADMVGIGGGFQYRDENGVVDVDKMIEELAPAVKKINDAGLMFGYHNHAFEFFGEVGSRTIDEIYAKTDWKFILDTGWADLANSADVKEDIERFKDRLVYVHLKDFKKQVEEDGKKVDKIVPLYYGDTPIDYIIEALNNTNTIAAYVEQDSAPQSGDSWNEMKKSIDGLKNKGWVK